MNDRALKPPRTDLAAHPMKLLDGSILIMTPVGTGYGSAMKLSRFEGVPVDLDAIADLICRHLNG